MKRPDSTITFFADKAVGLPFSILRAFGKEIIKELIDNADGVILPGNLGTIYIEGREKAAIDKKLTKEYGRVVYHQNYETEGYSFRLQWNHTRLGHMKRTANSNRRLYLYNMVLLKPYDILKDSIRDKIKKGEWHHWFRKD